MALERTAIVAAALDLLDQTGLEGLTMRKLAEALNVQAPSLYWHFPGKPALLDAMANALLEDVARTPVDGAAHQVVLRRSAAELRRALQARRDGARVYAGTFVMGENVLRLAETMIGALMRSGLSAQTAMRAGFSLLYYVLGFVIEEQAWQKQAGTDPAALAVQLSEWGGRFPAVEQALPHFTEADEDERFAFGVDLILNGLAQHAPSEAERMEAFFRAAQPGR